MIKNVSKYILIAAIMLTLSLLINGCGGGSGGGSLVTNGNTIDPNSNLCTVKFNMNWNRPVDAPKYVSAGATNYRFFIEGEGITGQQQVDVPVTTDPIQIQLPPGNKSIFIGAYGDVDYRTLLSGTYLQVYLEPGSTIESNVTLGVSITEVGMQPPLIMVPTNTTLIFTNYTGNDHALSGAAPFDNSTIAPGQSQSIKFTAEGNFGYTDSIQPSLTGDVIVRNQAIFKDYLYVANRDDNTVSIIDRGTYQVIATIPVGNYPTGLAFAASTPGVTPPRVLVVNENSNSVSIINVQTQAVTGTINAIGTLPERICVNNGNRALITDWQSGAVSTLNLNSYALGSLAYYNQLPGNKSTSGISNTMSSIGEIYVSVTAVNGGLNYLSVLNGATLLETLQIPVELAFDQYVDIEITQSGQFAYCTLINRGRVDIINTNTHTRVGNINVGGGPYGITSVGNNLYVANLSDDLVSVINMTSQTVTATIPVGNLPTAIIASDDSTTVYVANTGSNTISVISTATNTVTRTIPVGAGPVDLVIGTNW